VLVADDMPLLVLDGLPARHPELIERCAAAQPEGRGRRDQQSYCFHWDPHVAWTNRRSRRPGVAIAEAMVVLSWSALQMLQELWFFVMKLALSGVSGRARRATRRRAG